jgi:hypothetical protein
MIRLVSLNFRFRNRIGQWCFPLQASLPQFLRARERGAINHRDSLKQRRTSNLQTPIAKETRIANSQNPERIARIGCWSLEIGASFRDADEDH